VCRRVPVWSYNQLCCQELAQKMGKLELVGGPWRGQHTVRRPNEIDPTNFNVETVRVAIASDNTIAVVYTKKCDFLWCSGDNDR